MTDNNTDYDDYRKIIIKALEQEKYSIDDLKSLMHILMMRTVDTDEKVTRIKKKTCKICGEIQSEGNIFVANRKICKECFANKNKTYYNENKTKWVKKNNSSP
jgi:formylmethanofuran dehydrogenase subunit E